MSFPTILINPESLEVVAGEITAWGDELQAHVTNEVDRKKNDVHGLPEFQGQAPEAYRAEWENMALDIRRAIEEITDVRVAEISQRLRDIGGNFAEVDAMLAQNTGVYRS